MIDGLIFDKDGTLFDFRQSWGGWTARLLDTLALDAAQTHRAATLLGYNLATGLFARNSPVIAATTAQIAQIVHPAVPGMTLTALTDHMNRLAATAPMTEAVPLLPLFTEFRARGLRVGLATNDTEAPARAHLGAFGLLPLFDFVAGADTEHGGKPAPGMLLAFARDCALDPARVVMVGDSRHDLEAGRAAGIRVVAVLTGVAERADLAPHADAVLPDIGHLPAWLDQISRG